MKPAYHLADKATRKAIREQLKAFQRKMNIEVFHYPEEGITVAVRQTGLNMVEYSVAICSEDDLFDKKTGRYIALERFYFEAKLPLRISIWASKPLESAADAISLAIM